MNKDLTLRLAELSEAMRSGTIFSDNPDLEDLRCLDQLVDALDGEADLEQFVAWASKQVSIAKRAATPVERARKVQNDNSVASLTLAAIERGVELLNHIDYQLAETPAEREQIYRLRYRAYLQEGAIEPRTDQRVTDHFDDLPNTWIFGVYYDGALASSIRISVATPESPISPSVAAFPDVLEPELKLGKILVDPTRFVADPMRAKSYRELPYLTVRLAYVACEHFGADLGLSSIRVDHAAFYRRVFLQEMLAPARLPPGMIKPVCLVASDYQAVRERIFHRYPYFRTSLFERRMLFERRYSLVTASSEEGTERGKLDTLWPLVSNDLVYARSAG